MIFRPNRCRLTDITFETLLHYYLLNATIEHLNSIVNSDGDIKLYLTFCCIECV
jgi:hypothetical protein